MEKRVTDDAFLHTPGGFSLRPDAPGCIWAHGTSDGDVLLEFLLGLGVELVALVLMRVLGVASDGVGRSFLELTGPYNTSLFDRVSDCETEQPDDQPAEQDGERTCDRGVREVDDATQRLDEAGADPEVVQLTEEARLHDGREHAAGRGEVERDEDRRVQQRREPSDDRVQADTDRQHAGCVEQ